MAIYTSRGLKIRIEVPYAFGLMSRLYPKVTPFRILKTTEGIESLSGFLSFTVGIVCFLIRLSPIEIAVLVAIAHIIGTLINLFGFYIIPSLISLSTLFSYLDGCGVFIFQTAIGFIFVGWGGVLAFYLAKLSAHAIEICIDFMQTKRYQKLLGHPLTSSEVHFFNAYRIHVSRKGVSTDINLNENEIEEESWKPVFEIFAMEWPEIVRRFTI